MNAEIISVGTELLLGETINTDAADVARLLSEFGINVFWQTGVGDNPGRLEQIVRRAKERSASAPRAMISRRRLSPPPSARSSSSTRRRKRACAGSIKSATPI